MTREQLMRAVREVFERAGFETRVFHNNLQTMIVRGMRGDERLGVRISFYPRDADLSLELIADIVFVDELAAEDAERHLAAIQGRLRGGIDPRI